MKIKVIGIVFYLCIIMQNVSFAAFPIKSLNYNNFKTQLILNKTNDEPEDKIDKNGYDKRDYRSEDKNIGRQAFIYALLGCLCFINIATLMAYYSVFSISLYVLLMSILIISGGAFFVASVFKSRKAIKKKIQSSYAIAALILSFPMHLLLYLLLYVTPYGWLLMVMNGTKFDTAYGQNYN